MEQTHWRIILKWTLKKHALDSSVSAFDSVPKIVIKSQFRKQLRNFVNVISHCQLVEKQTRSS